MDGITPNWFAFGALLLWPAIAFGLYARLPVTQATLWTILGGYLLLPVGTVIKIEMIPAIDKLSIPNLAALAGCMLIARRRLSMMPRFGLVECLILCFLMSPVVTSLLNTDAVTTSGRFLPGVDLYDGISSAETQFIGLVPFLLGRQFFRNADDTVQCLRVLVLAGLAYSLAMLFEIRMSPQLHTWIYGYFPHSFLQQIREGGFRPVVFLGHGLLVAFFAATTVIAAAAFYRAKLAVCRVPNGAATAYLGVVLVLCKTLGALVYAILLAPLVLWSKPRLQMRVAVVLAVIALTYPMLRTMDLVPTNAILDLAGSVGEDREQSLQVRFDQEKTLLEHASQRIWFGWGRFGRSRVYDAESGKDISVTDGRWIIILGSFGVIGFIAEFGLLTLSVFRAASALRFATSTQDQIFLAALALIISATMIDQLPNSSASPWTFLLAGALLARAEALQGLRKAAAFARTSDSPHRQKAM